MFPVEIVKVRLFVFIWAFLRLEFLLFNLHRHYIFVMRGCHALFNHFLLIMSKVELVLSVERLLPEFLRERWILKTETLHPNQGPGCLSHISPYQNQLKFIKNLIVASESGAGSKREFHEIKDLAQTISKLQADLKRTNSILRDMAEAQGLDLEN